MSHQESSQYTLVKSALLVLFVASTFFLGVPKVEAGSKTFTNNGIFVVPANVRSLTAQIIGGGGGGGGADGYGDNHAGGAGGSGGNTTQTFTVSPGQGFGVTVGSGGWPGIFTFNNRYLCSASGTTGSRNAAIGQSSIFNGVTVSGGGGGTGSSGDSCIGVSGAGGTPGGSDGEGVNCNRNRYPVTVGGSNGSGYGTGGNSNGNNDPGIICPKPGGKGAVILTWPTNGTCGATYQSCSSGTLGASALYQSVTPPQAHWWCNGSDGGTDILCVETANCGPASGKTYAYNVSSYPDAQCPSGSSSTNTTFPPAGSSSAWLCQLTDSSALYSKMCQAWRSAAPAASCTLPWGGSIASGSSVTAYSSSSVTSPTTCASVSQTRTCSNGSLSGSYTNQDCTVAVQALPSPPASVSGACPLPGTTANLSWSAPTGATYYQLRVNNTADGWTGTCTSAAGDFCNNNVSGTSYSFSSSPRATYSVWVHACNTSGCSSPTSAPNFTCAAPVITTVNGVCSSTAETCTRGTYSNSPADTSTTYRWTCLGTGSPVGTNSGTCTASKATAPVTTVNGVCSSTAETCTAGTYSNSPADTSTTYRWTCLGSGAPTGTSSGTCTAAKAAVPPPPPPPPPPPVQQPDLTAGAVSPTTATAGTAQTFSSTVSNIGQEVTGNWFYTFMQVATSPNGGGTITDTSPVVMAALNNGGSSTFSTSYTFPSNGTNSLRVCADKSSSGNGGMIDESNEGNNCGAWTNVTVSSAPPPPPVTCTTPWGQTIADGVSVQAFSVPSVVSPAACPASETRTCNNGSLSGSYTNSNCTVLTPTLSISAAPSRVHTGGTTSVSWSASGGVTSCSITKNGTAKWSGLSSSGVSDTVTAQTVYTITCNIGSPQSVTVNVIPLFQEF